MGVEQVNFDKVYFQTKAKFDFSFLTDTAIFFFLVKQVSRIVKF